MDKKERDPEIVVERLEVRMYNCVIFSKLLNYCVSTSHLFNYYSEIK